MHVEKYLYRCIKCGYSFEEFMTPIVDLLECPRCHSDMMWCMNPPPEATKNNQPEFLDISSQIEGKTP